MKRCVSALAVGLVGWVGASLGADKTIVLIAGKPSHPPGMHEFRAGCLLLQKCLKEVPGLTTVVYSNGWPHEANAFAQADAMVIYADGGAGHPAIQGDHRQTLDALARKGVGLGFMHYGVEIPSTNGGPEFLEWVGGYYEHLYSVNPMWSPDYKTFPKHAITRGVQPFSNRDEWYFNIRWRPDEKNNDASSKGAARARSGRITPILVATPSEEVRRGPYVYPKGPYQHIIDAGGRKETMMWAYERPGGGRGFGFTGGHTHANWGNDNQRKVLLNALLWIAKMEVPPNGVESTVTPAELEQNLDLKEKRK
jgi:hypothetical protein